MTEGELIAELLHTVEDSLPEHLRKVKRAAFSGDADSQNIIGLAYLAEGLSGRDMLVPVGMNFLARAAKQGHLAAQERFRSAGEDWNDY